MLNTKAIDSLFNNNDVLCNYGNDNYLVSLYVINILIRNIDIFIMTMIAWVFIIVCVFHLVWAKPFQALPKSDRHQQIRFPLYGPMFRKLKSAVQQHVQEVHVAQEPANERFEENSSMQPGPGPVAKSDLFKCAEARLEEATAVDVHATETRTIYSPDAIMDIVKATDFATHKHHFQRRKDPEGTPYIEHPVGVAHILTHVGKVCNPTVIIAALLHDTVEDTDTTFEEIQKEFGTKVRNIVEELTDDKNMDRDTRKKMQILHARNSSFEAKLVKLADKLHNLRDIERSLPVNWTEQRKTEYFNWAKKVVDGGLRGANLHIEAELDKMFDKYCTTEQ